ncbi:dihydrofolate reductase [uncultured Salinisphaera sp.]|uniref:dihydrofolate reductase n=1 Tax=uncultured Salinisphaera sp. TaxID=359372 RepID=UPI0032B2D393|tara:strand:- start:3328 stop:3837 length:510 start_codon:yes stop_codon:yes gene_type:complete
MTQLDRPRITFIVAMDANRLIGADGGMPWHIPGDLPRFKRRTRHKPVLMGRKTFESIGKPLPQRDNIVLSRSSALALRHDVIAVHDVAAALAAAGDAPELMVIGGAEIYRLLLDQADCLDITHIEAEYEGDTWFPAVDWAAWQIETEQRVAAEGDTPAHRFVTWIRRAV